MIEDWFVAAQLIVVYAVFVVSVWIFPRLFLAQFSEQIWQSIRRHPGLHVLWAIAGIASAYLFFKLMGPAISYAV